MSLSSPPKGLPSALSPLAELDPFGKIRLVAFDLDGTLLRSSASTPGSRVVRLQRSAKSFGVHVTLATGRTLWGARKVISAFGGLSNLPVVLYNGSVVIQPGEKRLISAKVIPAPAVVRILEAADSLSAEVFLYRLDEPKALLLKENEWPESVYYSGSKDISSVVEFNGMAVEPYSAKINSDQAMTAILILPRSPQISAKIMERLSQILEISVTCSGNGYIEVKPSDSSKASGVLEIARHLGVAASEVLAVGDNDNDVELLSWAGISVAVSGASQAAAAASTYHSCLGPERAAIEILDLVRLAKRLRKRFQSNASFEQSTKR